MNLDDMKSAYDAYNEELKIRGNLLKAILSNNKNDWITYQEQYIDLYDKTNLELIPLLNKISFEESMMYVNQSIFDPKYKDLVDFFLILHSYKQTEIDGNNAQKFIEFKDTMYFNFLKWYLLNHGLNSHDKNEIISEFIGTTTESVSLRNILANKEELNTIFDNIILRDEVERQIAIDAFIRELDLFIMLVNVYVLRNNLVGLNNIPKPLIMRLILMNILTKKYQLGFRIEEYITRFYETHDITKNMPFIFNKDKLKESIDDILMEINDITNEYINYIEKGKAY